MTEHTPDIVINGSGMGGATLAAGLAGSGFRVRILEKGGNTKFYGAVLLRYRREDCSELAFPEGGVSPASPSSYEEIEPCYSRPYPHGPVPDGPAIAKVCQHRKNAGLIPASFPLGVDSARCRLYQNDGPKQVKPATLAKRVPVFLFRQS